MSSNGNDLDLESLVGSDPMLPPPKQKVKIEGMSAADLEALVHKLTATRLVELLQENDPTVVTPQLLQAAMRFLADNKVTGLDIPGAAGEKVRTDYAGKAPFKLTGTD